MTALHEEIGNRLLPHLPIASDEAILVAGDPADALLQHIMSSRPELNFQAQTADHLLNTIASQKKIGVALIVHHFCDRVKSGIGLIEKKKLLSRVRDVFAERVLHVVIFDFSPDGTSGQQLWTFSDSLAMGFVKLGYVEAGNAQAAIYDFDIKHYKTEPDWLNARHWAHPLRWDQNDC